MQKLTEENWREEFEKHPLLRAKPFEKGEEIPELFQALQALKYEDSEPSVVISNYKSEGDHYMKIKNYSDALISYTKAINLSPSTDIIATLLSNRAGANYCLENYGSCLKDINRSLKYNSKNIKTYIKGILASLKLFKYENALQFCLKAKMLDLEPQDKVFIVGKENHIKTLMKKQMDFQNIEKAKDVLKENFLDAFNKALKIRGIDITSSTDNKNDLENYFELHKKYHFINSPLYYLNSKFHKNESDSYMYLEDPFNPYSILHWPMIFLYPEYDTYDFIIDFNETQTLMEQLTMMFPSKNSSDTTSNYPEWDLFKYYSLENMIILWDKSHIPFSHNYYEIDMFSPLNQSFYHMDKADMSINIMQPFLSFIVLSKKSKFYNNFIGDSKCEYIKNIKY